MDINVANLILALLYLKVMSSLNVYLKQQIYTTGYHAKFSEKNISFSVTQPMLIIRLYNKKPLCLVFENMIIFHTEE